MTAFKSGPILNFHSLKKAPAVLAFALCLATAPSFAEEGNYQVTVLATSVLADASEIEDFLGAGGPVYLFSTNPNSPLTQAWRRLGLKHVSIENLHAEAPAERWLLVTRMEDNSLKINFTDYDRYLSSYLLNLGATPFIGLGKMPRALSSHPQEDDYYAYGPKDMDEWEDFVARVVGHNVEAFGLRGISYNVMAEPDQADSWKANGQTSPKLKLEEHVRLYAATYRAVKKADPLAQIGGPSSVGWQVTRRTLNLKTQTELVEWIRQLASYNAALKRRHRVNLDFLSWQDYGWSGQPAAAGAEAAADFLRQCGFDPGLPKRLAGGKDGSWSGDYLNTAGEGYEYASHILQNALHEFKDPRRRQFAGAIYFTFFSPDSPTSLVRESDDGSLFLTPAYAAFQMLNQVASGSILESSSTAPIEALAVRDKQGGIILTLNNPQAGEATVSISIKGHGFDSPSLWKGTRIIDIDRSIDGRGLEVTEWEQIAGAQGNLKMEFHLTSFGSAQLLLYAKQPAAEAGKA